MLFNRDEGEFFTTWSCGRYTMFRMHNNTWQLSCIMPSEDYVLLQYLYDTKPDVGFRIVNEAWSVRP